MGPPDWIVLFVVTAVLGIATEALLNPVRKWAIRRAAVAEGLRLVECHSVRWYNNLFEITAVDRTGHEVVGTASAKVLRRTASFNWAGSGRGQR